MHWNTISFCWKVLFDNFLGQVPDLLFNNGNGDTSLSLVTPTEKPLELPDGFYSVYGESQLIKQRVLFVYISMCPK